MRRREVIASLGGGLLAWPLAVRARQVALPTIGWLSLNSAESSSDILRAFRQGLGEAGYVEGQNVTIEFHWADGRAAQLTTMAADLVRRQVSLIMAVSDSASLAAKAATKTIPIVFSGGNDPVKLGLVTSLSRPGANITGVINLNIELGPKRLELLHEMLPSGTDVTTLVNPTNASFETITDELQETARRLALALRVLHARNESEIDAAFADIAHPRATMLVIAPDAYYMSQSAKLAALTSRDEIPSIFQTREFVVAGGLASYATSRTEPYRIAASYVARILKGAKPQDLPVQRATRIELIINLKTAKALRLAIPPSMLAIADEVME
jgi:putative tryptophan/tyrosine transport system substrate-binding protein